jgi:hypothetical protein
VGLERCGRGKRVPTKYEGVSFVLRSWYLFAHSDAVACRFAKMPDSLAVDHEERRFEIIGLTL